jgi:hypothetical protein
MDQGSQDRLKSALICNLKLAYYSSLGILEPRSGKRTFRSREAAKEF